MAMSNYTGGFADGVIIRGVPLTVSHPGRVFWVGNATAAALPGHKGAHNAGPGTFDEPFSTVAYAITQTAANRGDIIFVKPGHNEDLTAAGTITSSVAGVAIIGLGTGALRPTFDWDAAAATWSVTAANCSFYNLVFNASFLDVTAMFVIGAAAHGTTFAKCHFTDEATNLNAIDFIEITTGANNFTMQDCKMIGGDAQNDSFITVGATDGFYISDSYFASNVAQAAVVALIEASDAVTNLVIRDCYFRSNIDGALFITSTSAANSGLIANCYFSSINGAGAVTEGTDMTGCHHFECYVAGEADAWGLVGGGTVYS